MTGPAWYQLVAELGFNRDYQRIDRAANRNPSGPEAMLRRQLLRTMVDLATGKSNGHHVLKWIPGDGDLRDCVTEHVWSDPQQPPDYRLVFREVGPAEPGGPAQRELLAIRPRHGSNNVYAHVLARLKRGANDQQPGLHRFDVSLQGRLTREAELDARRAIAHAWAGQQPLRSSRPIALGGTGRDRGTGDAAGVSQQDGRGRTHQSPARHDPPTGYPWTAANHPGVTGWPEPGK
jgi:hypothetical protein